MGNTNAMMEIKLQEMDVMKNVKLKRDGNVEIRRVIRMI